MPALTAAKLRLTRALFTFISLAGVGTRNYYRKLGYRLQGPYMVKMLK